MRICLALVFGLVCSVCGAAFVDHEVEVKGDYVRLVLDPKQAGAITVFEFVGNPHNLAAGGGLIQEGFGVGSFYVPNRRINERLEVLDDMPGRPVLRYSYDCDGPNIRGLHVTRVVEPLLDAASVRVTWRIANEGDEAQWVAPWVRNEVAPGGAVEVHDRIDVPTRRGIVQPTQTGYVPAARNWIAVTDPVAKETVYAVFNADHIHSFKAIAEQKDGRLGFVAAFVPRILEPGTAWETVYRVNAVRGLTHVDFATDELAVQIDHSEGTLKVLMSAATALDDVEIHGRILDGGGKVISLPAKRFSIAPNSLIRCTYAFDPPGGGAFEFLAQLRVHGQAYDLGRDTSPPHGGMDTQFRIGKADEALLEPWTDAPHALDRGPRMLERTMAASGSTAVWFESSLFKIFRQDVPKAVGRADPTHRIVLARNERESFQIVIRPPEGKDLGLVQFRVNALVDSATGHTLAPSLLKLERVEYVPVRVPTHFETATGLYPDPLEPHRPFTAKGGECSPVWVTLYAPPDTPAGTYTGPLELLSTDADPIEMWIEATVMDFDLPRTPALKTDFGFGSQQALERCKALGFTGSQQTLEQAYLTNALEHRVTLRELSAFPAEAADYEAALRAFEGRLETLLDGGASVVSVPPSLADVPEQLRMADDFVVRHGLENRVFCPFSSEPLPPSWPRLLERIEQWREIAPHIPLTVSTFGLEPLLAQSCGIWTVHSQVLDTLNNKTILPAIREGREVWWYVNHAPPRPYGNFFLDFAAIEHRILFWQAWALGIRGFHYASVNATRPGQNPYEDQLDVTPANGNGILLYPGPAGPVDSIRWANIRDGIDDYDYLTLLMGRIRKLQELGGHPALLERAADAANLDAIIPSLVTFTRDPTLLEAKRAQIGQIIVELDQALER